MERVIGNYTRQENRSFPLDCETLETIQNNIDMLGALGNMVGDKTILNGCEVKEGGGRQEGYVFLKTSAYPMGEVLHFPGSSADSDYLHLATTSGDVIQGSVTYRGAYTTRQVLQGGGEEQWAWEELSAPVDIGAVATALRSEMASLADYLERIKPSPLGVVEMYCGSSIPENYAMCDGQALSISLYPELYQVLGTTFNTAATAPGMFCLPDLRGRFIVGAGADEDYNTIGKTGGEKTHTLTVEEMPSHNHSVEDAFYAENIRLNQNIRGSNGGIDNDNDYWTRNISTGNAGGGAAHENRPPFFVLFYIMRLK